MSDLGATSIPGAIVGTDSAVSSSFAAPIVEVVMGSDAEAKTAPAAPRESTAAKLSAILARGSKEAAPAEPSGDEPPTDLEADPDDAPKEDPPAEDKPPKEPKDDAEPDPAAAALHAAELEAAKNEAALLRAQLQRVGPVTDDDRLAYVDKPIDALRAFIAQRLGVKPDAKDVDGELAFLRQELTIDAIGADTLGDDRKLQRSQEHTDRRWRLGQQLQAASKETSRARDERNAIVRVVSTVIDATKADHPYLALAEIDGRNAADDALDLWVQAVQQGRVKVHADDAANAREATRLANDFYRHRADRILAIRPADTSPAPATAPTKASAPAVATGAPKQAPSKAPAPRAGSATPTTLSARQAAAAPSAKAASTAQPREIVDPHDPAKRAAKIAAAAARLDQRRPA